METLPSRLPDRYILGPLLGQGGMGSVFQAHDRVRGEDVALKIIRFIADGTTPAERTRAFEAEIRFAARLLHPRIVRLYDAGVTADGHPYYSMELVGGAPLTTMREKPPPWPILLGILEQVLDGLAFAHARGVIHRDVKPDNLLLRPHPDDAGYDVILTDLGLAYLRERWEEEDTASQIEVFGTPRYMAPEQLQGHSRDIGPWTDLYAVGALLYELLAGVAPFEGPPMKIAMAKLSEEAPPLVVRPGYAAPEGIEEVVARLLERDIWRRFELAADVRQALKDLPRRPALQGRPRPLLAPLPEAPPPEPAAPPASLSLFSAREPLLVGRAKEKQFLWEKAREVLELRETRVVLLEGEAGVGKSRLCRWLSESLEQTGLMRTISVREEKGEGSLHSGLWGAVQRHLKTYRLDAQQTESRLSSYLRSHGEQDPRERRALLRWLVPPSPEDSVTAPERDALFIDFLRREAWRGGVLLWLDDIASAAESEGFAFLERLLLEKEMGEPLPCLVVATARREDIHERPGLAPIRTRLRLRPEYADLAIERLPEEDSLRLVEHLLSVSKDVAETLAARSAGNPFFATLLLSHLVSEGLLEEGPDGIARLRPGVDVQDELPESVEAVFNARIESVLRRASDPNATRLSLCGAALLGIEFSLEVHEEALRDLVPGPEAREVLKIAWAEGLLKRGLRPGRLRFDHPLLWETLHAQAERLGFAKELHAGVARALSHSSLDAEDLCNLARHLEKAGSLAEAALAYSRAGEKLSLLEISRAKEIFEHAEALLAHLPEAHKSAAWVQIGLGRVAYRQNEHDDAQARFEVALSLAEKAGDNIARARALHGQATVAVFRGQWKQASTLLEAARELATGDAAAEASIAYTMSTVLRRQGELEKSREQSEAARFLARVAKDRRIEARAILNTAYCYIEQGDLDRADPFLEEAGRLAQDAGDRVLEVTVNNLYGDLMGRREKWEEAKRYYEECLRLSRAAGLVDGAVVNRHNLAFIALLQNDPETATEHLDLAQVGLPSGRYWIRAHSALYRAWAAALQGDSDSARARLEESLALGLDTFREMDIARAAEGLFDAATLIGDAALAREAYAIARAQYLALGRTLEAERLSARRKAPPPREGPGA